MRLRGWREHGAAVRPSWPRSTAPPQPWPCPPVCAAAPRMESALFSKLCRECGLVGGALTPQQVDLAFAKVADKVRDGCD